MIATSKFTTAADAPTAVADDDNTVYVPAEESTVRSADVVVQSPVNVRMRPSNHRVRQRIVQNVVMSDAQDVDRLGSRPSAILDSIFQVYWKSFY